MNSAPFAEVVESSLHVFKAQCWQWDQMPQFGSLTVITQGPWQLFGIVYDIQTGSLDPMRTVHAYQKSHEELRLEQPQIFAFLRTTFSGLSIAYQQAGDLRYQLAPEPPKIHAFVRQATVAEQEAFFANPEYVYRICQASFITHLDELLLTLITQQAAGGMAAVYVHTLLEALSLCWQHDYRRLKIFTRRAQQLINH